ncbi:hypothetical protein G3I70_17625, partial [Actinomadura bangladeshensis]|nr:hypothetical protein [Actinomadura bangladeshensis]
NLVLAARTAAACADRIVLEICAAGAESAETGAVLRLHALNVLERRAPDLLNEGAAPPGLLDLLWEARRRTCDELAPRAAELAAAFDLPAPVTAPTAFLVGPTGP